MGRDITHNLRAAMYSPADQSLERFFKAPRIAFAIHVHQIGRTNLDIGCGTGLTSVIHQQKLGILPTICDVIDMRHVLARCLPSCLIHDDVLPFESNSFDSSYVQTCSIICKRRKWFSRFQGRSEYLPEW